MKVGKNSGPIRILHIVNSLDPGGMENGLVNVARKLDPQRFKIHVACLDRRGKFAERLPSPPDNVIVLGKKGAFSWQIVRQLRTAIRRINPGCIHTHNLGPLIYTSLASTFGHDRPILHGEHSQLTSEEQGFKRLWQRRILYHACSRVHTVSETLRQQLIQFGFPVAKIDVVENGVDTDRFVPAEQTSARALINMPRDVVVLGIVGRFGAFKGHMVLIEAFERLAIERKDLHLLIVGGGGSEENAIRKRVEASEQTNRIHLTGFQEHPERFYQAIDLLVVPSTNEGMSNAVLEAMACGVPALTHKACGNQEVITNKVDGIVADLATSELLLEQIRSLLINQPFLREMGRDRK